MIFIDSGAFIARHIRQDQHHAEATRLWYQLESDRLPCWTSNHVLDEVFTLLGRIAGNQFAHGRAQSIYDSRILSILRPDEGIEREALRYFLKYSDQKLSFTDSISFALMKRHGLKRAFAFDEHFRMAGFDLYS